LFALTVHLRNEKINPTSEKSIQSRIDEKKRVDSGEIRTKDNIKPSSRNSDSTEKEHQRENRLVSPPRKNPEKLEKCYKKQTKTGMRRRVKKKIEKRFDGGRF
jgi:hypothetical protein